MNDETWEDLCKNLAEQKDENVPLTFKTGDKEISCYINQTQYGDGGYELYNVDVHDVATIIYHPSAICVDSGTIGLICLNQLCSDDDELAKLVKEIKDSDYGLVFGGYTSDDKVKLEQKLSEMKLGSEIKPVLTVEETEEDNMVDCPYCDGSGYFDSENCCPYCDGSGEIEDRHNAFSHEVKLGHYTLFKVLT
jgi:hypothetical protein